MAQKQIVKSAKESAKDSRQKKLIERMKKKEYWMKWGLVAALIIILLLLLFIGYATDWTTGLRKDTATTPISTSLDSSRTGARTDGSGTTDGSTGSSGGTGGTGGSGGSGSGGTNSTTNNSSTVERSTNNNATTERNNSTSTNNTSTTTNNNTGRDALISLFSDTNVGENIDDIIAQARAVGVSVDCTENLLIKECTFTAGGVSFSTKSLLSTGTITSLLNIF